MEDLEIPQYFLCPISLQIMTDPVTTVTGITYDRDSIEKWLSTAKDTPTCPVTKQMVPRDSDLTPNHMLRRLIQGWCMANARHGVDRIPTPKSPLDKASVAKLIAELEVPRLEFKTLEKLEALVVENDRNHKCMAEAGAVKAVAMSIVRCYQQDQTIGLDKRLHILHLLWTPNAENKQFINESNDLIDSILWVLNLKIDDDQVNTITNAVLILKKIVEIISPNRLERFKPEFFKTIVMVLKEKISPQATKAALHILIELCPWGRNRIKIVEAGAVFELIETELGFPEKKITELIFCLLANLCSCADGRAQLLGHACGVAMVTKKILRVSPATDDRAVHVLDLISKFSGTSEVLVEMLRVGAVAKLCMVIQADSAMYLKEKARGILRMHSDVWNNSPCIAVYLLTRHAR